MTGESLSTAAVQLAEAGWPVFPVSLSTKRPKVAHGHLDATTDTRRIRSWSWLFDHDGGVATPTGNGLLVIDVDPRNGGTPPHWLPETLTVKTQNDGLHFYYKITPDDIRSRAGLFGVGVDSKCRGGYVLLPPSPGYRWVNVRPRATLLTTDVQAHFVETYQRGDSTLRLPPEQWYKGVIHDQVVAWAAWFAGQLDADDVPTAVWALVQQARDAGVPIDNARGHIDTAIRWVLAREANSQGGADGPSLA